MPQEAWVQNTSVVENVCFRQKLDPLWLETVLEACALWPDVRGFPAGVHTKIGEQVRVSGPSCHRQSLELGAVGLPGLWATWWEGQDRGAEKWGRHRAWLRAKPRGRAQ